MPAQYHDATVTLTRGFMQDPMQIAVHPDEEIRRVYLYALFGSLLPNFFSKRNSVLLSPF